VGDSFRVLTGDVFVDCIIATVSTTVKMEAMNSIAVSVSQLRLQSIVAPKLNLCDKIANCN